MHWAFYITKPSDLCPQAHTIQHQLNLQIYPKTPKTLRPRTFYRLLELDRQVVPLLPKPTCFKRKISNRLLPQRKTQIQSEPTTVAVSETEAQMARRLIPTLNRVLIEKIIPPSKTTAGILLPESSTKLNSGKVVAVGPGAKDKAGNVIPVAVKEGDTVLLPEYGGTQVKLGDKELHLYRDEDILGTLHE